MNNGSIVSPSRRVSAGGQGEVVGKASQPGEQGSDCTSHQPSDTIEIYSGLSYIYDIFIVVVVSLISRFSSHAFE